MPSYYDTVYQAAKDKDSQKIREVLQHKGTVDLKTSRAFGTPAEQLACEGDVFAVEFLKDFGASPDLIAAGYARGGHHWYVNDYLEEDEVDIHQVAAGYAIGGYHRHVAQYRDDLGASVNTIAAGYAIAGRDDWVEHYLNIYRADIMHVAIAYGARANHMRAQHCWQFWGADPEAIVYGYFVGCHLDTIKTGAKTFFSIEDLDFRKAIFRAMVGHPHVPEGLVNRLGEMLTLIEGEHFSINEAWFATRKKRFFALKNHELDFAVGASAAACWCIPEIRILLLMCGHQNNFTTLSFELLAHIAAFFVPMSLSSFAKDLLKIMQVHKKNTVIQSLEKYASSYDLLNLFKRGTLGRTYAQRAEDLQLRIKNVVHNHQIADILSDEIQILNRPEDEYYQLLALHERRIRM